jgi:hypothetical protein
MRSLVNSLMIILLIINCIIVVLIFIELHRSVNILRLDSLENKNIYYQSALPFISVMDALLLLSSFIDEDESSLIS